MHYGKRLPSQPAAHRSRRRSNVAQTGLTPPSSVEGTVSAIGARIAALRHGRGWSLQELSRRAGVSPAAIHKIEKKGMTPTITSLMRIAGALGRSVGYFIEEHDRLRPVAVTRRDARPVLTTSKSGVTLESVAGRYGPFFLAGAAATVDPRASSGEEPMNHPGEELMLVLEGTMEWRIEGERYRLDPGDSIHFRTDRPHAWCNPAEEPARAVWLTVRPSS